MASLDAALQKELNALVAEEIKNLDINKIKIQVRKAFTEFVKDEEFQAMIQDMIRESDYVYDLAGHLADQFIKQSQKRVVVSIK